MNPSKRMTKNIAKLMKNKKQKAYWKWFLSKGIEFKTSPLTPSIKKMIKDVNLIPRKRSCFYNAQMLALANPRIKYFEGYAISKKIGMSLQHGFNVIRGKVIDVTWEDGDDYFGIHIPTNFIGKSLLSLGVSESLLWRYAIRCLNGRWRKRKKGKTPELTVLYGRIE